MGGVAWFAVVALSAAGLCAEGRTPSGLVDVDYLTAGMERSNSLIEDVSIDYTFHSVGGEAGKRRLWILKGDKEYLRTDALDAEGEPPLGEVAFDGDVGSQIGRAGRVDRGLMSPDRPRTLENTYTPRDLYLTVWGGERIVSQLRIGDATVRPETEEVDGHECFVVDAQMGPAAEWEGFGFRLWVDPEAGFRPRRMQRTFNGKARTDSHDIEIAEVEPGIWIPTRAISEAFNSEGILVAKVQYSATRVEVNEGIPDERFRLEFPPGTRVQDGRTLTEYVVGEESLGDAAGDGGDVKARASSTIWPWLEGVVICCCGVAAWLIHRHRSR